MNKKNTSFFLAFLLILTSACATSSNKKINNLDYSKDTLFPKGLYRHDVQLSIVQASDQAIPSNSKPQAPQNFHFQGLVKIELEKIETIAVSPFGITLFKIIDNLKTGEIKSEVYLEQIKKHESKILDYYAVLKSLLLVKGDPTGALPTQVQSPIRADTQFKFLKYDSHKIPEEILISHPQFNVTIKVMGYEI